MTLGLIGVAFRHITRLKVVMIYSLRNPQIFQRLLFRTSHGSFYQSIAVIRTNCSIRYQFPISLPTTPKQINRSIIQRVYRMQGVRARRKRSKPQNIRGRRIDWNSIGPVALNTEPFTAGPLPAMGAKRPSLNTRKSHRTRRAQRTARATRSDKERNGEGEACSGGVRGTVNNYGRYGGGRSRCARHRYTDRAWGTMDRGLCGLWCWPSTSGLGVNTVAGDARPTQRCGQSG